MKNSNLDVLQRFPCSIVELPGAGIEDSRVSNLGEIFISREVVFNRRSSGNDAGDDNNNAKIRSIGGGGGRRMQRKIVSWPRRAIYDAGDSSSVGGRKLRTLLRLLVSCCTWLPLQTPIH